MNRATGGVTTRSVFLFALAALGLTAAVAVSGLEARYCARDRARDELMYYPKGPAIEKASLGHTSTAADLAWLRAVQYYGEHKRSDRKFDMMGHIFEVITDLDPRFVNAYIFGGLTTAQDAGDVPRGLALMEKGLRHNPDDWQMNFETGFVYYTCARDFEKAARCFRRAAELPGATESTMRFAAFVSHRAGDPRAALYLWQEFYNRTDNAEMKQKALENIERIEAGMTRDAD